MQKACQYIIEIPMPDLMLQNLARFEHRNVSQGFGRKCSRKQFEVAFGYFACIPVIYVQSELLHLRKSIEHCFPIRDTATIPRGVIIRDISTELIEVIKERKSKSVCITHCVGQLDEPSCCKLLCLINDNMIDGLSELHEFIGMFRDEEETPVVLGSNHVE